MFYPELFRNSVKLIWIFHLFYIRTYDTVRERSATSAHPFSRLLYEAVHNINTHSCLQLGILQLMTIWSLWYKIYCLLYLYSSSILFLQLHSVLNYFKGKKSLSLLFLVVLSSVTLDPYRAIRSASIPSFVMRFLAFLSL